MAEQYEVTSGVRIIGRISTWMARVGIGRTEVLTLVGCKSGEPRSTPVSPIVVDGVEYLVAPYGSTGWVRNARARPSGTLGLGSNTREIELVEVGEADRPPIVSAYHARERFPRKFMDVPESPTLADFAQASGKFPVFRVVEA
jgi:deazaflavin-dependent oxidoreductase (nitroreductase family)